MFSKLKQLFLSESLLDEAFKTTLVMLEFDHQMYQASRTSLRETDAARPDIDVKETDVKVNKYEREVRRKVLTHLSVSGIQHLVPGLVLVSIVIDVERIGDYTKNISDLAGHHESKLSAGDYEGKLQEIEQYVGTHFKKTIAVLKTQDKDTAREVMSVEEVVGKSSDWIVNEMITNHGSAMASGDAVSLALYARYLKRINAHLTNIASAVVNPFPRIGFRDKKSEDAKNQQT
jgi:phosphate uptake regulator